MMSMTECRSQFSKFKGAYNRIKDMIISNEIRPQRRLMADNFAEYLGISRTPVREALQRLAAEQFISSRPTGGFFSKSCMVSDQRDLIHVMKVLLVSGVDEPGAARREGCEEQRRLADVDRNRCPPYDEASPTIESLFLKIVASRGNRELDRVFRNLLDRTHAVRSILLDDPASRQVIDGAARELASSLARNDAKRAVLAIEDVIGAWLVGLETSVQRVDAIASRANFP